MSFPLKQQICTACITEAQLVHSKTASKLVAPIKIIIVINGVKIPIKLFFSNINFQIKIKTEN